MKFYETPLKGAYIIELDMIHDERGFFARTWCNKEIEEHSLIPCVAQCSISYNEKKGTLRGMHFQAAPYEEVKIVRCTKGAIYDVIIDLRPKSCSFMRWYAVELRSDNYKEIYIPKGFAHGFQTLEDNTEVYYQISEFYHPECSRGLRWDDENINIVWPEEENRIISKKDKEWKVYTL